MLEYIKRSLDNLISILMILCLLVGVVLATVFFATQVKCLYSFVKDMDLVLSVGSVFSKICLAGWIYLRSKLMGRITKNPFKESAGGPFLKILLRMWIRLLPK